ncbi:hypothetical protein AAHA92_16849 [Salvia divinorum]|uniref:Uncharacterized protein n=1 Tax=Salvia divinorum TaxID=28513 RepID=A0ABD1GXE1_SALDI
MVSPAVSDDNSVKVRRAGCVCDVKSVCVKNSQEQEHDQSAITIQETVSQSPPPFTYTQRLLPFQFSTKNRADTKGLCSQAS